MLLAQFAGRRDLLKARSGMLAVETLARAEPRAGSDTLLAEVEQLSAGAHELAELRLLALLRSGLVDAKPEELDAMERLCGGQGAAVTARLGLDPDADPDAVRAAAAERLAQWQRRAESPMASREVADARSSAHAHVRGDPRSPAARNPILHPSLGCSTSLGLGSTASTSAGGSGIGSPSGRNAIVILS